LLKTRVFFDLTLCSLVSSKDSGAFNFTVKLVKVKAPLSFEESATTPSKHMTSQPERPQPSRMNVRLENPYRIDEFLARIMSFIPQSVLRQVHSLFQSQFSTECDLVLPLPISSTVSFPESHPAATSAQLRSMKCTALTVPLCLSSSCLPVLHLTRPRKLEYVIACCPEHLGLPRKSGSQK
jgi:hypothetical protein